jgi:hypothetical protein
VEPNVSATLTSTDYLSVQTAAFWRLTQWTNSQDPLTAQLTGTAISRSLFEFRTDVRGPTLVRTFQTPDNGFAGSFKHQIEPYVSYSWLSPFDDRNRIFKNDGIDSLASGTSRIDYGIRNRIFAKVKKPGGLGASPEILAVSVGQSYYTDARAAAVDTQVPANTIGQFSNLEIRAITRRAIAGTPASSRCSTRRPGSRPPTARAAVFTGIRRTSRPDGPSPGSDCNRLTTI